MEIPQIVGITGFARSGKTEVLKYLVSDYGFYVVSPSLIIHEHLATVTGRSEFTREEMRTAGHELRREIGPDFVVQAASLIDEPRIIIDGLRNLTAFRTLIALGGNMIGLVARPDVRYERALSSTDYKQRPESTAKMIADEAAEMNSLDRNGLHILPILWSIDPANIIDTSDMSIEQARSAVSDLLSGWEIERPKVQWHS